MAESKKEINTLINTGIFVGSTYSQVARVTVTDFDITLEFAFISPSDPTKGQVVSRVTLPKPVGFDLAKTIMDATQLHEKKKKGGTSD